MYVNILGDTYEFNAENTIYFTGETLIDGVYADINEDDYVFIPTEAMDDPELILNTIIEEQIRVVDLVYYDPEAEPFCFIINALCRYFGREIDEVCDGEG
jgi:hypothetical protein